MLQLVSRTGFDAAARKHKAERHARGFSSWGQFVAMLFCQLGGANWKGTVTKRPKYWGKLVMELVYEYLDKDVAKWLKENAPAPRHGQNYHQWLSGQYGLKKLVEHIWLLIGISRTCDNMAELRQKMAELNGKTMVQFMLPLPKPTAQG
jgi:hypothetical protein